MTSRKMARRLNQVVVGTAALAIGLVALRMIAMGGRAASVTVPDVQGMPLADAMVQVEAAGLVARSSDPDARGAVVSQQPAPGTAVRRGASVALQFGGVSAYTEVPDVRGHRLEGAREALSRAGLVPAMVDSVRDSIAIGTVVGTHPEAGNRLRRGSHVSLTLSAGAGRPPAPGADTWRDSTPH